MNAGEGATPGLDPARSPAAMAFGGFRVDLTGGRLLRGNEPVALRRKTWSVLRYMVERPGVLIAADELLDAIWPDVSVTPQTLNKSIGELRTALGDDPHAPRMLETVYGRGFRFIAAVEPPTGSPAPKLDRTPLERDAGDRQPPLPLTVGRDAETDQLTALLQRADTGQRQLVFVTGQAGVGKTALVNAFLDSPAVAARGNAVVVARADCFEQYGSREPFFPIFELLEHLMRSSASEPLVALMRRVAPMWLVQIPWLLPEAEHAALRESLRGVRPERMLRELAALLEAVATDRTWVLVLEDLQWSDAATVDALSLVAQRRESARVLIIGTYRPAAVSVQEHALAGAARALLERRRCTELPLHDLDLGAVRRYLGARFPDGDFTAPLAQRVHAHTGGQPLFVVAVVEHLLSRGLILDTAPGWALATALDRIDLGTPQDVRRMIEAQLQRLSPAERQLLEVASVAGQDAAVPLLAATLDCDVADAEMRCDALARVSGFLRPSGFAAWSEDAVARSYTFTHDLYRQVVYEDIPESHRARLHRRIGVALENAYGSRAIDIAPLLAVHFERGRDPARALPYLVTSGARAQQRFAYREAVGYLESGLATLARLPPDDRSTRREIELRLALGAPLAVLQGYAADDVRANYERAAELCAVDGSAEQIFETLHARWFAHAMRADEPQTSELLAQMTRVARDLRNPDCDVLVQSAAVRTAVWQGRFADTTGPMQRLRAIARSNGAAIRYGPDPEIAAAMHHAAALWFLGDCNGARATARAGVAQARAIGSAFTLCAALTLGGILELLLRNPADGDTLAAEARRRAAEQGFAFWEAFAVALQGWAQIQRGEAAGGCREVERGLAAVQATGVRFFVVYLHGFLGEGCVRAGDATHGLEWVDAGIALADRCTDRGYLPELWRLKGELLLMQSNGSKPPRKRTHADDPAEACFRRALDLARTAQAKALELRAAASLARASRAPEAFRLLDDLCNSFGSDLDLADLDEARGLLRERAPH